MFAIILFWIDFSIMIDFDWHWFLISYQRDVEDLWFNDTLSILFDIRWLGSIQSSSKLTERSFIENQSLDNNASWRYFRPGSTNRD